MLKTPLNSFIRPFGFSKFVLLVKRTSVANMQTFERLNKHAVPYERPLHAPRVNITSVGDAHSHTLRFYNIMYAWLKGGKVFLSEEVTKNPIDHMTVESL